MEWVLQLLDEIDDLVAAARHWSLGAAAAWSRPRSVALDFAANRRSRDYDAPIAAAMPALQADHGLPR